MTSPTELLPCPNPWCKSHEFGPEGAPTREDIMGLSGSNNSRVGCPYCHIEGPICKDDDEAIAAWNDRTAHSGEGRSNGAGEDAALERWSDIADDSDAIVRCGDRWKVVAAKIGCSLHGFNDGTAASFVTPDGNVIEIGPKFRAFLANLTAPPTSEEGLRSALAKITPIRVEDGPDYASIYFADGQTHSTQAMTVNPQDWLDIQAAYDGALFNEGAG